MRPDIIDLREFYGSHLGQMARLLVRRRLRGFWPNVRGLSVLGLGFATPYLSAFNEQAERTLALMPAQQGVGRWPRTGRTRVALSEEHALPLPDASIDRVILAHSLENTEQVRAYLREVWRVLTPNGRLLVVVPNRRGLWTRFENTPFGHGRPYSPGQISRLLRDTLFQPIHREAALYLPPINSRVLVRGARAFALSPREPLGAVWHWTAAYAQLMSGDDAGAAQSARLAIAVNPRFPRSYFTLAASAAHLGAAEEARWAVAEHQKYSANATSIAKLRELMNLSSNPAFQAQWSRLEAGLRLAGMPE